MWLDKTTDVTDALGLMRASTDSTEPAAKYFELVPESIDEKSRQVSRSHESSLNLVLRDSSSSLIMPETITRNL